MTEQKKEGIDATWIVVGFLGLGIGLMLGSFILDYQERTSNDDVPLDKDFEVEIIGSQDQIKTPEPYQPDYLQIVEDHYSSAGIFIAMNATRTTPILSVQNASTEILRIEENGDVYYKGTFVGNDSELPRVLKESFLITSCGGENESY